MVVVSTTPGTTTAPVVTVVAPVVTVVAPVVTVVAPVVTVVAPVVTVSVAEPVLTVTVAVALAPLDPEAAARATTACQLRYVGRKSMEALTLTEGVTNIDDFGLVDVCRAGLIGAIVHTVTEVHVGAEAVNIVVRAAQSWGLGQHIVDTCFLPEV